MKNANVAYIYIYIYIYEIHETKVTFDVMDPIIYYKFHLSYQQFLSIK